MDIQALQAAKLAGGDTHGSVEDRTVIIGLQDVTKTFGRKKNAFVAVDGVNLNVYESEFLSILGPVGSGKTTLLRLIAGLDIPSPGSISIEDKDCTTWPAHRRPVNTIFKEYALFPHMSVNQNIAFGMRMRGMSNHDIGREAMDAIKLLDLMDVATYKPKALNRDQALRTALARALVTEPRALLLDEPFGGLELKQRRELQKTIRELQRNLKIPFIQVTEDQEDALSMSDRVAVMNEGRIEQVGSPGELYERPCSPFVAGFVGSCNLIKGRFLYREGDVVLVETELGKIRSALQTAEAEKADQNEVTLAIRPEKVIFGPGTGTENQFHGTVEEVEYQGPATDVWIKTNDQVIHITIANSTMRLPTIREGDPAVFQLPAGNLILMDAQ